MHPELEAQRQRRSSLSPPPRAESPRPGSLLLISLRPWPGLEGGLEEIAGAVDSLCARSQLEPLFLPFQPRDREISLRAARLVQARVWEGELDVAGCAGDPGGKPAFVWGCASTA
ncbi:MAG: hypothetical protein ACOX20_05135 [Limnochordia bacterium]